MPNRAYRAERPELAVVTVKGICAMRGPGSRVATALIRASLLGGLCLGAMVGGATAASAADHAGADKPGVSQPAPASSDSDSAQRSSGSSAQDVDEPSTPVKIKPAQPKAPRTESKPATPAPVKVTKRVDVAEPEPAKPAKPEPVKPAEPEPVKPAQAEPAKPAQPQIDNAAQAEPPEQAGENASTEADKTTAHSATTGKAEKSNGARHKSTVAHTHPAVPESALVGEPIEPPSVRSAGSGPTRNDAQPRAPDVEQGDESDVEPPGDPSPAAPASPPPPASSATSANAGGIGGLRNAHAILPNIPDLSTSAAIVVAQRDIGPDVSTRSAETTASPD